MKRHQSEGTCCLLLFLAIIFSASGYEYYIYPDNRSSVATNSCLADGMKTCLKLSESLSSITANMPGFTTNVSLLLLPGSHDLSSTHTLSRLEYLSIKAENENLSIHTNISCRRASKLQFSHITTIHIQGITLVDCLDNQINSVSDFIMEDATILAKNERLRRRGLTIINSSVIVLRSYFLSLRVSTNRQSRPEFYGGGISCSLCSIVIIKSTFIDCNAPRGGALYCRNSNTIIVNSTFTNNEAKRGGAVYFYQQKDFKYNGTESAISVLNRYMPHFVIPTKSDTVARYFISVGTNFTGNNADRHGGVMYSECNKCYSMLVFTKSRFIFNRAGRFGGVFRVISSRILVNSSTFQTNEASGRGGVGFCYNHSRLEIEDSVFYNNKAGQFGGAIYVALFTQVIIKSGEFHSNLAQTIGGSIYIQSRSNLFLQPGIIEFTNNSARYGAVINIYESLMSCNGTIYIHNNNGSISTAHSIVYLSGNITFKDNNGSLYFLDSEVSFMNGNVNFTKHAQLQKLESDYTLQGGCLTLFISRMSVNGTIMLVNNSAIYGGGVLSIASRISIERKGQLKLLKNTASSGGGMYLVNSELYIEGPILLQENKAESFGGGIHCFSSTIVIVHRHNSQIEFVNNTALFGGGISIESGSKFYIKKLSAPAWAKAVYLTDNAAMFGGAIYVADNSTSSICKGTTVLTAVASSSSECFIQIFDSILNSEGYPNIEDYYSFSNNTAPFGQKLYGGLLDRCTVNVFNKNIQYSLIPHSFEAILNGTTSDPVRVCQCTSTNVVKCKDTPSPKGVMKGKTFTLNIAAVDQVQHEVKATIYASLASRRGYLGDGQESQKIEAKCTRLNFSIITPVKETDKLVLYAIGPCNDKGISSLKITVSFIPCQCPVGFEPIQMIEDQCVCGCHQALKRFFSFIQDSDCDPESNTLTREKDFWISLVNENNVTVFLAYKQCPSEYCHRSTFTVQIDFSSDTGPDVQCANNRTGVLCGSCQQDLSLSLGSSRCIKCPLYWPAFFVTITITFILAGLCLVCLILALNLTVATGTLNAIIFYANVVAGNREIFVPFKNPNFHSVIIDWFNLDLGFDICFFKGLKADGKIWLQLMFPAYIILIVVAIIITGHHSRKFSNLIAKRNPVATLATLILLSYAKLLHGLIGILSFAILSYIPLDVNNNTTLTKIVWLRDGSIEYLKGVHIPLFIAAVLILFTGLLYTFLLLSWQWLVRYSHKAPFCWLRSTKLTSFIDAYHAPYTPRNRYWTGMLLLARVILYLIAAVNVSGEPSVNLLAISLIIGCVLLLYACSGITVYKRWTLNCIEFATYFNILSFTAIKFYIQQVGGNNEAVAYISISAQVIIFVFSLLIHIVSETHITEKIKQINLYRNHFSHDLRTNLISEDRNLKVTFSEVDIVKPNRQKQQKIEAVSETDQFTTTF